MLKLNKTLVKKGFKSIFKTKLFSILMFVIVLISGATYTMLESSSSSLSRSYNKVMREGKIADSLVKENFIPTAGSSITLKIGADEQHLIDLEGATETQIKNLLHPAGTSATIDIYAEGTGDYQSSSIRKQKTAILYHAADGFRDEVKAIKEKAREFKSWIVSTTTKNFSHRFIDDINKAYSGKMIANEVNSLSVVSGKKAFKVVGVGDDSNQAIDLNNIITYDGTTYFTSPQSNADLRTELEKRIKFEGGNVANYSFNETKGFRVTAVDSIGISSFSVEDPSAYEAVVSPAYANANGKISISRSELLYLVSKYSQSDRGLMGIIAGSTYLSDRYKNNLVWVDQVPYFIVGIGTTPDFVYPIIDAKHPTVDVKNQAVLFVNNRGYERIYNSFRANPQENYISIKYNEDLSNEDLEGLKDELSVVLRGGQYQNSNPAAPKYIKYANKPLNLPINQWPNNINVITSMHDAKDQMLLVQERVRFLKDLNSTINTLSFATTTLLVVFVLSIIVMVFNVLLSINRKAFATMLAIGYSKTQIALSNALSAIILVGLPSTIGYGVGHGMQYWFTNIFSNYWTIPIYGQAFSLVSLMIIAITPIFLVGLLISLVTLIQLRFTIPDMLKESTDSGISFLTKSVAKMKYVGVKTKYAIGLSVKNIGKLFLLTITSLIAMTSLMVGMGTVGKASFAYNQTTAMTNYNFEVDLYTPTLEGGQYSQLKVSPSEFKNQLKFGYQHRDGYLDLSSNAMKPTYDNHGMPTQGVDVNKAHWHIPGIGDAAYGVAASAIAPKKIEAASTYLKNKLQLKTFIDKKIAGFNPWDIAQRLMPENQKNLAVEDDKHTNNRGQEKGLDFNNPTLGDENKGKALIERILYPDSHDTFPYVISYNQVLTNENDELYTYIDANINDKSGDNFHIKGIKPDTIMVNGLQSRLVAMANIDEKKDKRLPILINKYIAEKYHWSKGDTVEFNVNNKLNRNLKSERVPGANHTKKVFIYDVINGYDSEGIYTVQSKANQLLGMNYDPSPHGKTGFNGVFSKSKNPYVLQTLPLYSPSGIYLGSDTFFGAWDNVVRSMLGNSKIWQHGSDITSDLTEFKSIYSETPFVSSTSLVNWSEMNRMTFKNISSLSSTMISIVEAISIALSVIFTLIVAGLLLLSNKKKIAALWTLGYRKREIGRIFLSIYIAPVLIALIISIPISIGILIAMKTFVMNLGSVLIPFSLVWWIPFVALGAVAIIFIAATLITIYMQKQSDALEAFKGD